MTRQEEITYLRQSIAKDEAEETNAMSARQREIAQLRQELQGSGNLPPPSEPTFLQDVLKGTVATNPAGFVDMARAGLQGGQDIMRGMHERFPKEKGAVGKGPHPFTEMQIPGTPGGATKWASEKFHEATGFPEPQPGAQPSLGQTIGEFISPDPFSKLSVLKKGIVPAAKALGNRVLQSTGSAVGLHTLPNITEEGSALENVGKALIGGMGAGAVKGVGHAAIHPKQTLAKVASLGTNPNPEVFKHAKRHGIELPLNVGLNSRPLNWITNALSNSVFASNDLKESLHKSNRSMLDAVNRNIEHLGNVNVNPSVASSNFRDFLTKEEGIVNKVVNEKYEAARKLIKPGDAVVPKHAKKVIDTMHEILTRDVKSPETKFVVAPILKIADEWGLIPKNIKFDRKLGYETLSDNPKIMEQIVHSLESQKLRAIPLEKLSGAKTEIGNILGHNQKVLGMKKWLTSFQNALEKDLESSTNVNFVRDIKKAKNFYKTSYANRFKEDLAESILTEKSPLYTFENIKNVDDLNMLKQIANQVDNVDTAFGSKIHQNNFKKGNQLVDSLRKAKVNEILNNAITDEGIKTGAFAKIFEGKETRQEFFRELIGHEQYRNMAEVAKIMREQQKSGRELLNTSSSTYVASDMLTIGKVASEAGKIALGLVLTGHPSVTLTTLGTGLRVAVPYAASKLISDPEFTRMARAFALARKNGNVPYSDRLLKNMVNRTNQVLKATMSTVGRSESQEQE